MVKLYAICLDAFPETPELQKYLLSKNLSKSTLVCAGAFTCCTMTSQISGALGSEIVPPAKGSVNENGFVKDRVNFTGGIGYNTSKDSRFYDWRSSKESLTDRLNTIIVHNNVPWMRNVIIGKSLTTEEKTKHYRELKVVFDDSKEHDFYVTQTTNNTTYTSTNPSKTMNMFSSYHEPETLRKFYSNETKFIEMIQNKNFKFNGLFWTDLCHWHEYVYYKSTILKKEEALDSTHKWLENWNFDEPDSIFYVYADHSHRVESHLDPPGYMTWVYFKDNREDLDKRVKLDPYVSSMDFYQLTESIFGLDPHMRSVWSTLSVCPVCQNKPSQPLFQPSKSLTLPNQNRIFACEDSRYGSSNTMEATTFLRGTIHKNMWVSLAKITDTKFVKPGFYVTLCTLENKHTYTLYYYANSISDKYTSVFTTECKHGLDDRKRINTIKYQITPDITDVIKRLMQVLS